MIRRVAAAFLILAATLPLTADSPVQGGAIPVPLPLFPANNWWNTDVSAAPTDSDADAILTWIGKTKGLHPDFGGDAGGGDVYGFPFIVVDGNQAKKTVDFSPGWPDQSDGVDHDTNQSFPFYPIPDQAITQNAWVEGGQPGNVDQRADEDRHVLIVDKTNDTLYELYNVWFNGTQWEAASGAFFDMKTNNRRPEGWTSADAAGLAILPGLVRYDEVGGPDEIRHAFRFTTRSSNGYVYPASHDAGSTTGAPPMGLRLRLKAAKDISAFPADVQKIFRAMKKYGLILADNGTDMYVSGTYDTRWNNDVLNPAFSALKVSDFEVIQRGWAPSISPVIAMSAAVNAGDASTATITAYDSSDHVATGYRGTLHFTSTDGAATLPLDYTFTAGDAGVHTFSSGFTFRTPGSQILTATDTVAPTITGWRQVTVNVGPPTPTGLVATATSTTHVDVTWNASAGATKYELVRASSTSGGFTSSVMVNGTSYGESVTAGGAYVYKVRAIDTQSHTSAFSIPDAAAARVFTDDPLVARGTRIKAIHLIELRDAVNALRTTAGLPAATFTDPSLPGIRIKAVHLNELRSALAQARASLGLLTVTFTDPTLTARSTVIKAAHLQELRTAVK